MAIAVPKFTVADYSEMLRKLGIASFAVVATCVTLLRMSVSWIDLYLKRLDVITDAVSIVGSVKLPLGTALIAAVFVLLSAAIKLHDRISDVFRIRAEFDFRCILTPMALLSGATLNSTQFDRLQIHRDELMQNVFYAYASSSPGRAVIDSHAITQALTSWSWYWLCAETIVSLLLGAAVLVIGDQVQWALGLLFLSLCLLALMRIIHFECVRYAKSEIRHILNDDQRRAAVAANFNAL